MCRLTQSMVLAYYQNIINWSGSHTPAGVNGKQEERAQGLAQADELSCVQLPLPLPSACTRHAAATSIFSSYRKGAVNCVLLSLYQLLQGYLLPMLYQPNSPSSVTFSHTHTKRLKRSVTLTQCDCE